MESFDISARVRRYANRVTAGQMDEIYAALEETLPDWEVVPSDDDGDDDEVIAYVYGSVEVSEDDRAESESPHVTIIAENKAQALLAARLGDAWTVSQVDAS